MPRSTTELKHLERRYGIGKAVLDSAGIPTMPKWKYVLYKERHKDQNPEELPLSVLLVDIAEDVAFYARRARLEKFPKESDDKYIASVEEEIKEAVGEEDWQLFKQLWNSVIGEENRAYLGDIITLMLMDDPPEEHAAEIHEAFKLGLPSDSEILYDGLRYAPDENDPKTWVTPRSAETAAPTEAEGYALLESRLTSAYRRENPEAEQKDFKSFARSTLERIKENVIALREFGILDRNYRGSEIE